MRVNGSGSIKPAVAGRLARREEHTTGLAALSRTDSVTLSGAGQATLQDRATRIEELKALVAAPDFLAPAAPITNKLIEGALSSTSRLSIPGGE
jgi:hypothetical protein